MSIISVYRSKKGITAVCAKCPGTWHTDETSYPAAERAIVAFEKEHEHQERQSREGTTAITEPVPSTGSSLPSQQVRTEPANACAEAGVNDGIPATSAEVTP